MKKAKGDEATSLQKLFEAYRDVSKQLQEHMDYVDSKKDNPKFDERKTIQRLRDKAATKFVEFDASLADAEL
jgi:DNA-binding ferritin-like protein